jgi:succinyl-CoA synthetase beta subunit
VKIHEYQAKEIRRRFGVATPPGGRVADDAADARGHFCAELGGRCVVKAQIHAGGRGKGGGVKLASLARGAESRASEILGMKLRTPADRPEGQEVRKVLIEEALDIDRELYVAITLDRQQAKPIVMASASGGMDIEEVAARDPQRSCARRSTRTSACCRSRLRAIVDGLGLEGKTARQAATLLEALARAYLETDATLAEINPLMITKAATWWRSTRR